MGDRKFYDSMVMACIVAITFAASAPFFYDYLYYIDSANFALGIKYFNIDMSQPHPPGYPLFIFLGKALNQVLRDENLSLILIANFFALSGILLFYKIVETFFGKKTALWSTLIFAFNPVFWFYREVALTYTIDLFAATATLYTLIMVRKKNSVRWFYIQMALLGLSAGLRPTIVLLLAGAALYTLYVVISQERKNARYNHVKNLITPIVAGFCIFTTCMLAWMVPTILLSGGITHYFDVIKGYGASNSSLTSILNGASLRMLTNQIKYFCAILKVSVISILIVLAAGIAVLSRRKFFNAAAEDSKKIFSRPEIILLAASFLAPPLFVYTLVLFGQPGYVLIMLPAIMFVASFGIHALTRKRYGIIIICLSLLAQVFIFTIPGTTTYPFRARLYGQQKQTAVDRALSGITPYMLYFNLNSIREDNLRYSIMLGEINRYTRHADPGSVLLIIAQFHPYHEGSETRMNDLWASHIKFYYPETDAAIVDSEMGKKEVAVAKNYRIVSAATGEVLFGHAIRTIIIVTQKLDDRDIPKGLRFTANRFTYVASDPFVNQFNFLGVTFRRK